MERNISKSIADLLYKGNISYNTDQMEKIDIYINTLLKWNEKINLISKNNTVEILKEHIIDSIYLFDKINNKKYKNIVDIGSGNGLPGIIIKVFHNEKEITLIEQRGRKASFLKETVNRMHLKGINVFDKNALLFDFGNTDLIVSKAFGNIKRIKESIKTDVFFGEIGIYQKNTIKLFHIEH